MPGPIRPVPAHRQEELLEPGNIDLYNRPPVRNPDGSSSTVRSLSFNQNDREILIPTVVGDRVVPDEDAIQRYLQSGQHLGMFRTPEGATQYAGQLHDNYERGRYNPVMRPISAHGSAPASGPQQGLREALDNPENWKAAAVPRPDKSFGATAPVLDALRRLYEGTDVAKTGLTGFAQRAYNNPTIRNVVGMMEEAGGKLGLRGPGKYIKDYRGDLQHLRESGQQGMDVADEINNAAIRDLFEFYVKDPFK